MGNRNNKIKTIMLTGAMTVLLFTACGAVPDEQTSLEKEDNNIYVVSREKGSGTRDVFAELFGMKYLTKDGLEADTILADSHIAESAEEVIEIVADNKNAIGYVSLGLLDGSVKPLKIDGQAASLKNIKSGKYKVSRPFNLASPENRSPVALDFIDFVLSKESQTLMEQKGYIPASAGEPYLDKNMSGEIMISGSSSMAPIMEELKARYIIMNPEVTINLKQSDSDQGVISATLGLCDIAMVSRELSSREIEIGLEPTVIGYDGIVVIVNKENDLNGLTYKTVKEIYTGEVDKWSYYKIFNLLQ